MKEINEKKPLVSICIPAFNRPIHIIDLLRSVDCAPEEVEIVVCEDHSPDRKKIREAVNIFKKSSLYKIRYFENSDNLGFDGNIRELVNRASGKFLVYMGDDDLFIQGALEKYIVFLKDNMDMSYILRSYVNKLSDNKVEHFNYLSETTRLEPGENTVAWLFKRSVVLCGFTISRKEALKYNTPELDGTLLYQVYIMSCVCLKNPSIYCDIPIAEVGVVFEDNSMFGTSKAEREKYSKGTITDSNSINFTKSYFEVSTYIDHLYGVNITDKVRVSLSKYSYPFLSIQRKRGLLAFLRYAKRLQSECGLGVTHYFAIYKWSLAIFGERFCNWAIRIIKKFYSHTPNL
jgi:glycosyltransferase involved in cell wall biosynthesis